MIVRRSRIARCLRMTEKEEALHEAPIVAMRGATVLGAIKPRWVGSKTGICVRLPRTLITCLLEWAGSSAGRR